MGTKPITVLCLSIFGLTTSGLAYSEPVHQVPLFPVDYGEAVVTHFCGMINAGGNMVPNPDGAVVTLVDARIPPPSTSYWPTAGQLWYPPHTSNLGAGPNEWTAKNLGIIFGLAIGNQAAPDPYILVAASPGVYGDYDLGATGVVGPAGMGGIYLIDGSTGQISVFMPTGTNGVTEMPNHGPGLGNICFDNDQQSNLLYATNLDDGKIYVIQLSSLTILYEYDPFGANQAADGYYATLGERVFAVAVDPNQPDVLYFSVWLRDSGRPSTPWPNSAGPTPPNPNNTIWSVQLDPAGLPVGSPQLEIVIPYLPNEQHSNPVTDISFTPTGTMLVAERQYLSDYGQIDVGHHARILEYEGSLGNWTPSLRNWFLGSVNASGIAANAVGGVTSNDDSHTWATCDTILPGTYGITRLPFPGNTIPTRVTSSIPIEFPSILKNGMGEIDCRTGISPDPSIGACCTTDIYGAELCVLVSSSECYTTYNGIFYGVGTTCQTIDCGAPTPGACCYEDAALGWNCIVTDENQCLDMYQGMWYSGTSCSGIDCPPEKTSDGACCYMDDSGYMICVVTSHDQCIELSQGTYYGDGSSCGEVTCCEPVGACCISGNCLLADSVQCEAAQGIFAGVGVLCEEILCDTCTDDGDFDGDGDVDIADLLILISAWGDCSP